jgi:hypothetical protein
MQLTENENNFISELDSHREESETHVASAYINLFQPDKLRADWYD